MSGREEQSLQLPLRIRAARAIAIGADVLQIVVFPVFWPGAASIVNDALDAAVALAMLVLVGWHWAFLPTFLAELIPFFDLVPTWTAAVFLATRSSPKSKARDLKENGKIIDAQVVSSSPASPNPRGDR
ncbi:MAG TPA: hypothetical protein VKJ00_12740 [Thermoanaerobaculia bacterium]|nr:hypothetical protein [Thermoanaerobaculia bacterium]